MVIEIILLLLAVPVGLLISWMAKDELKSGRKWFGRIFVVSIALSGLFFVYNISYISLTCIFIAIVSLISLIRS